MKNNKISSEYVFKNTYKGDNVLKDEEIAVILIIDYQNTTFNVIPALKNGGRYNSLVPERIGVPIEMGVCKPLQYFEFNVVKCPNLYIALCDCIKEAVLFAQKELKL